MPRVAPAERARKETAFEALEVALKAAGRNNRPNENQRGYPAVTQAILWWKNVGAWEKLSADEQRLSLVSHSNWRTYRRKRGVPSPDLDAAKSAFPRLVHPARKPMAAKKTESDICGQLDGRERILSWGSELTWPSGV